jgi:type II secretory pathway predicted ATPase ExeA
MRSDQNPYAPGSGSRPPELAGRDVEIAAFDLIVARSRKALHTRPVVLHGLRGVGKTVLLRNFLEQADRANWLIVNIEASTTESGRAAVRQRLARSLVAAAHKFDRSAQRRSRVAEALSSITSFGISVAGVGVTLGVDANPVRANSGQIDVDLVEMIEDLGPALIENSTALGIFIDEMQDLDAELLSALIVAQHRAGQESIPFFVVGAGLPSLPALLSETRSYAERLFDSRMLGPLIPDDARIAVTLPAERLGASFADGAAEIIVDASEGYPFFIQTFAMKAWDAALDREIGREDAIIGVDQGRAELDMGFYPARWGRATNSERRYLTAMAELGGTPTTFDVATLLGSTPQSLSTTRQGLIDKGITFAPERGRIAFTVPGMTHFIHRQTNEVTHDFPEDS